MLITLPHALYAWGDGDKLSDGSCKFDMETGYIDSSLYVKDNESFIIINGGDSRYGTISTIYNALTCEKVTSGDPIKSNFSGLMQRKGFEEIDVSEKTMDKSFQNIITFSKNQDAILVKVASINSNTSRELKKLLELISDKSASTAINLSRSTKKLLSNKGFQNQYLNKISSLRSTRINYEYALALNRLVKNNSRIESIILTKFFNLHVKGINNIPSWTIKMNKLGKQNSISSFQSNIMNLSDFAKNLTLDNFLTSIEYKYVLKKLRVKKLVKIKDDNKEYGILLKYPNINIRLTNKPTCTSTGRTSESEFSCGFLWGNTCVGTYKHYNCNGETTNIAKIEQQLKGTNKIATALAKGWSYAPRIARRTKPSSYTPPNYEHCGVNDTCYHLVKFKKSGSAIVKCTKGPSTGQEKCLSSNGKKYATGCGISDSFAHHYSLSEAANNACEY